MGSVIYHHPIGSIYHLYTAYSPCQLGWFYATTSTTFYWEPGNSNWFSASFDVHQLLRTASLRGFRLDFATSFETELLGNPDEFFRDVEVQAICLVVSPTFLGINTFHFSMGFWVTKGRLPSLKLTVPSLPLKMDGWLIRLSFLLGR